MTWATGELMPGEGSRRNFERTKICADLSLPVPAQPWAAIISQIYEHLFGDSSYAAASRLTYYLCPFSAGPPPHMWPSQTQSASLVMLQRTR